MEEVKKCLSALQVTATLKTLPSTLYEMYDSMLLKIEPAHQSKAITALTWLSASDHVRIRQLSEAVIINPTADSPFGVQNRFPDPTWILDVLSCFVTRSSYSPNPSSKIYFHDATPPYSTVTLAHFTVQEYLVSSYILCGLCKNFYITPPSAREHIIRSSIIYMNNYLTMNRSPVWQDLVDFPLLFSANDNLEFRRVDQSVFSTQTEEMIFDFLSSDSKRLTRLLISRLSQNCQYKSDYEPDPLPDGFELDAAISYAALAGLNSVVRRFMTKESSVDAKGHWTRPGLFHAIRSRKLPTVKVFLDAGTDVNLRDKNGTTALNFAAEHGADTILRMLLDAGVAKVTCHNGEHTYCPASYRNIGQSYYERHGSREQYCEIIQMLLDVGATLTDEAFQKKCCK
jgi:hypothetical protein